jgi:hypothetical protein
VSGPDRTLKCELAGTDDNGNQSPHEQYVSGLRDDSCDRCSAPQPSAGAGIAAPQRKRILLNADWRFQKGDPAGVDSKNFLYDVSAGSKGPCERVAKFTEAADTLGPATHPILKPYILPTGNRLSRTPRGASSGRKEIRATTFRS